MQRYRWQWFFGPVACGVILMFCRLGWEKSLAVWTITYDQPHFSDCRTITAAAESIEAGLDPMIENPAHPTGTTLNYPRIWQIVSHFGVGQEHTEAFAITFALLLTVGLLVFPPGDLKWSSIAILLLASLSPAVFLAVERGNNDLVVFFLLALAIRLASFGAIGNLIAVATVVFAHFLKLFPVFALLVLLKAKPKTLLITGGIVFVIIASHVLLTWDDLKLISKGTPRGTGLSYGMNVLWMVITEHGQTLGKIAHGLAWLAMTSCVGLALLGLQRPLPSTSKSVRSGGDPIDALRVGAGVYAGTFLIGNNWDYRLIFLIFTVPQLTIWASSPSRLHALVARTTLVAIVISMWDIFFYKGISLLPYGSPASVLIDEGANWIVLFGLTFLAASSSPEYLRKSFRIRTLSA